MTASDFRTGMCGLFGIFMEQMNQDQTPDETRRNYVSFYFQLCGLIDKRLDHLKED
jgi:hypothetical protein